MAKMATCASVFAKMGNPWVSQRDGFEFFGRVPDENPDADLADMMRRGEIRQAPKRDIFRDPTPTTTAVDDRRRCVNILARMNREMRANTVTVRTRPAPAAPSTITAKRANKAAHGYWLYVKTTDGTETEVERQGERGSQISFKRAVARKDTVCVELWSNATGECVKRYQRRGSV